MRLSVSRLVLGIGLFGVSLSAHAVDFPGCFSGNDGGTYYVSQSGNDVWWLGMSADEGRSWTNVFHGTRDGNTVRGTWSDVPRGAARASGEMEVALTETGFTAVNVTGGFGGSSWTLIPCP